MPPKKRVVVVAKPRTMMSRPTVVVKPVKQVVRKPKDLDRIVSDMLSSITSIVSQPTVFVFVVIAAVLTISHLTAETNTDLLSKWIEDLRNNTSTKKIGDFLLKYEIKVYGVLWFLPAWMSVPQNFRVAMLIAMSIWIMIIPEAGVLEYMVQAIAIRMYFRVSNEVARVLLIAVVAVLYWAGFIFVKTGTVVGTSTTASSAASSPSTKPGPPGK